MQKYCSATLNNNNAHISPLQERGNIMKFYTINMAEHNLSCLIKLNETSNKVQFQTLILNIFYLLIQTNFLYIINIKHELSHQIQ